MRSADLELTRLHDTRDQEGKPVPLSSPLSDDPVCVLGHMVVADDMVHTGQGLVHVLLQPLQVLRLLVDGDDGVFQLHQTTLKGRQDGDLGGEISSRRRRLRRHQTPVAEQQGSVNLS